MLVAAFKPLLLTLTVDRLITLGDASSFKHSKPQINGTDAIFIETEI